LINVASLVNNMCVKSFDLLAVGVKHIKTKELNPLIALQQLIMLTSYQIS
jgi:hypothetical protein